MDDLEDAIEYDLPFEATTDAMAIVEVSDAELRIRVVNDAFEDAFACREPGVRGRRVTAVLGLEDAQRFRSAIEAGTPIDATVDLDVDDLDIGDGDALLRVRPFGADSESFALVTIAAAAPAESRPAGIRSDETAHEAMRGMSGSVVRMCRADDVPTLCAAAADLVLGDPGFDAFVADVEGAEAYLENVDAPIRFPHVADRSEGDARRSADGVRYDFRDAANGTHWDVAVQRTVSGHGTIQIAARTSRIVDSRLPQAVDRFAECFAAVLDRLEQERTLRAEREDVVLLDRVLRHEMLNGLNLVQARLDFLEQDVSRANRDHYETVASRVSDMIDRVEAIRKIRKDELVETRAYPLETVVRNQIDAADGNYTEASFSIVGSVPDVEVVVDDLIDLCLWNVLENAVQHADVDAPVVRIDASRTDGLATIRIADNGPGIPEYFDRSVFSEGVSSLEGDGHGEGLFLTRRIIESVYGGDIRVDESDDGGAEFVIELPLAEE